jgi:dolichol-phosphate mannosyltransferase
MIGIVIPVKNEPYLPQLLKKIEAEVTFDHKVYVQTEKGLSNAVLLGFRKALRDQCEAVIVMDGDGSHNPKYLLPLLSTLQLCDIAVGSRYINWKVNSKDSKVKIGISWISNGFFSGVLGIHMADCMSGFVAIKRSVLLELLPKLHPIGIKFMLEILIHSKGKFTVGEYPITFEQRKAGYSKNGFTQAIRTYVFTIKLSLQRMENRFA